MEHKTRTVHPVDLHVGARLRTRRLTMGLSQSDLGNALGVTFQQIQKYEKGTNRIGASRLFHMAKILKVKVQYFYADIEKHNTSVSQERPNTHEDDFSIPAFLTSPEEMQLCQYFSDIQDHKVKKRLLDLVKTLADDNCTTLQ